MAEYNREIPPLDPTIADHLIAELVAVATICKLPSQQRRFTDCIEILEWMKESHG